MAQQVQRSRNNAILVFPKDYEATKFYQDIKGDRVFEMEVDEKIAENDEALIAFMKKCGHKKIAPRYHLPPNPPNHRDNVGKSKSIKLRDDVVYWT
mmetsp:Transcript_42776/g.48609  ORF Transcript_42776/g.48609 Transcript_42776/m.48609 type:complete len:96 (-) Transcript_42776:122-409(-)